MYCRLGCMINNIVILLRKQVRNNSAQVSLLDEKIRSHGTELLMLVPEGYPERLEREGPANAVLVVAEFNE